MNQVEEFFSKLNEGHINFRSIKGGKKINDDNGYYNQQMRDKLVSVNQKNYEVYFVVNTGGYKNDYITSFNAVFIDLDAGRNEDNEYKSLAEVNAYKKTMLQKIHSFTYKPTYVVETRNGFHVYWFINKGATPEQFKTCEQRLVKHFEADEAVKKPAQLMRVPGYHWCKDKTNKFKVEIIEKNSVRYDINELISTLPPCNVGRGKRDNNKKYNNTLVPNVVTKSNYTKGNNVQYIKNDSKSIKLLQTILEPEEVKVHTHEEVYDYLKQQDLESFLGVSGSSFNCIFHEDNNPSANVFINEENGHNLYKCHSSSCGKSYTIIEVVMNLAGVSKVQALRMLRKIYKVNYHKTTWQKEKRIILEQNQRFLFSKEIEEDYPEINSMIKNYTTELSTLIQLAKEHLQTEYFSDKQDNPLFFSGVREISDRCGRDKKRVSVRLSLLTYLGLIRKVPIDEIPKYLLDKAKDIATKNNHKYIVNYYSIPPYVEETLNFCTKKVKEFKDCGFTIRGWGRELIYRTLGEAEADRVFPQMKGAEINDSEVKKQIERLTMNTIERYKWVTERGILEEVVNQGYGSKSFCERKIKQIIPEILEKYDLTKQKLNNVLKEKLGIERNGYPNIIYDKNNL